MRKVISYLTCLLIVWIICGAWIIVSWPHGTVVDADRTDNYNTLDFVMPQDFDIIHWDNWQIILTDTEEVRIIMNWLAPIAAQLQYIPEQRDCDDFAIIAKGVLAYEGYGNVLGLVVDYTKAHAYNCYWWLDDDGKIVLRMIEPQVPVFPFGFPYNHRGVIYW